jgi:ABC-type sugar transport system ATPase subunit
MTTASVELIGITKRFGGQTALDGVSIGFGRGEIHGLAGMNGSGKSTLVKILAGVYTPDEGTLRFGTESHRSLTPAKATELGLRVLHQDPAVFPTMTVADNISLGSFYGRSRATRVRVGRERELSREVLTRLGIEGVDPRAVLGELSPTERTMVAIARAVQDLDDRGLLVLDEPTASLPEHEASLVTDLVRRVAERGVPVLYITHDLAALIELSDRVSVLRDGRLVGSESASTTTERELADLMAGGDTAHGSVVRVASARGGEPTLVCAGVTGGRVRDLDLQVQAGEVVGIAGLLGSGRSTLLRMIAGAQGREGGRVVVDGRSVPGGSPRVARSNGIAFVPEDRRGQAAFAGMTLSENLTIAALPELSRPWWIRARSERRRTAESMEALDIRPRMPERRFALLSGGNQQKAIISRCAQTRPSVLLLDEPTQGVDVHARQQIHATVRQMAADGMAVVAVSSDIGELITISDRILVMRRGAIRAELPNEGLNETDVLHLAATNERPEDK